MAYDRMGFALAQVHPESRREKESPVEVKTVAKDVTVNVTINFNQRELDTFWSFIAERQWIWYRRFIEHREPPWTEDPILQKNKFTNVYRELDPGTVYCRVNILERDEPRPDIMFNVMLYRLMCSIPTYDGMGFQRIEDFDADEFEDYLRSIYDSGRPVFGNAYLISPYSSMGSEFKYVNVARLFKQVHRDIYSIFESVDTAPSLEKAFRALNSVYGFGPFLAYQIMVDLTYPLPGTKYGSAIIPWEQNDWAQLGPGAKRGFARLSNTHYHLAGLRWLQANQRAEFDRVGVKFPFLFGAQVREVDLTLANLQNCCCEFHKYRSIQEGTGKSQRIFIPRITGTETGRLSVNAPPISGRPRNLPG